MKEEEKSEEGGGSTFKPWLIGNLHQEAFFPSLTVLCWKQVCLFSVSPSGVKVGGLLVVVEAGVKKKSFPLLWLPQFNTQKQRGEGRERERKGEKRKKKSNS